MGLLVILTIGVVAGLMAALLLVMQTASDEAADANHAKTIAEVTDVSLELVLTLQVERGYSTGYLASGGLEFEEEMDEARADTDVALDQADRRWEELRTRVDDMTRERLDPVLDLRDRLDGIRRDVDTARQNTADDTGDVEALSAEYAAPIEELTSGFSSIVSAQGDADDVRRRVALAQIARAVRASGNERSLLTAVFTADAPLTTTQIEAIYARRALIAESLERFEELASPGQRATLDEVIASPSFIQTDAAIDLALDQRDEGDYGVDPAAWFVTATERVELLAALARDVNHDLMEAADEEAADAEATVRRLSVAAALILGLAALFGLAAASSIRHRRRAEEEVSGIAETLQRSLLPRELPAIDGVDLFTRYEASAEHARVGGDWFDALPLPDGRLGLMIGDVVGHGIQAAAVMGEVRHALRAMAFRGDPPEMVLRQVGRLLREAHPDNDVLATIVYAVFDPATGVLRYANAGHPPPLVRGPDRRVRVLDHPRSVLVGTHFDSPYEQGQVSLEPGSVLLLYTDGLVERAGEHLDRSTSRLVGALEGGTDELAVLADDLYERLIAGEPTDDMAMLLVRYNGPPDSGIEAAPMTQLQEDGAQQT